MVEFIHVRQVSHVIFYNYKNICVCIFILIYTPFKAPLFSEMQ